MLEDPVRLARALRAVSVAEAASWLLLIVATLVKYAGGTEAGVTVLGPVHGFLFLAYVAVVLVARGPLVWGPYLTLRALVLAVVPGGGLVLERELRDVRDRRDVAGAGAAGR